jgi:hypothetical protein
VISLSGCVAELEMGGVKKSASARAFQRTKEWVVSKGAPRQELSNAPKNVGFCSVDQKL